MILTKDELAIQVSMILDKFLDVAACASEPYNRVCHDLAELIQEQRDTAHAAAIEAAAKLRCSFCNAGVPVAAPYGHAGNYLCTAKDILHLTSANAALAKTCKEFESE